ncbi:MAG: DUF2059 domain-containing protein [Myxococcota bacterium]
MNSRFLRLSFVFCVAVALVLAAPPVHAAEGGKANKIRKLLEVTGTTELGKQILSQMFPSFRKMAPQVPNAVWTDLEKTMSSKVGELEGILIPIYDRHFTESDIDALITFYQTPVGKKFVQKLPVVTQESMTAGQKWGLKIGDQVVRELRSKGYEL